MSHIYFAFEECSRVKYKNKRKISSTLPNGNAKFECRKSQVFHSLKTQDWLSEIPMQGQKSKFRMKNTSVYSNKTKMPTVPLIVSSEADALCQWW